MVTHAAFFGFSRGALQSAVRGRLQANPPLADKKGCQREDMTTTDNPATSSDDLDTIRGILTAGRTAIVTTRSGDSLVSRPLALLDAENFEGTLWFLTPESSPKMDDVREHHEVNVAVADGKGYLSLSGTARVEHDQEKIDELWNPFAEAWFEKGREDPEVALLRVDVRTAEYWDTDKPLVAKVFEVVKGLVTKSEPDFGENRTVSL
jgi:general stress protein 26